MPTRYSELAVFAPVLRAFFLEISEASSPVDLSEQGFYITPINQLAIIFESWLRFRRLPKEYAMSAGEIAHFAVTLFPEWFKKKRFTQLQIQCLIGLRLPVSSKPHPRFSDQFGCLDDFILPSIDNRNIFPIDVAADATRIQNLVAKKLRTREKHRRIPGNPAFSGASNVPDEKTTSPIATGYTDVHGNPLDVPDDGPIGIDARAAEAEAKAIRHPSGVIVVPPGAKAPALDSNDGSSPDDTDQPLNFSMK